jgi:hypothetical protein
MARLEARKMPKEAESFVQISYTLLFSGRKDEQNQSLKVGCGGGFEPPTFGYEPDALLPEIQF